MNVYMNDWSWNAPSVNLSADWAKINRFQDLLKELNEYGMSKVIVPDGFNHLLFCGIEFKRFYTEAIDGLTNDQVKQISLLANSFTKGSTVSGMVDDRVMLEGKDRPFPSVILGNAAVNECPSVSFTFNASDAVDYLEGKLWSGDASKPGGKVINLYDTAQIHCNPGFIFPRNTCKTVNPLVNPLWNQEQTKVYMENHESDFKRAGIDASLKEALITQHATVVAQLNGWELDERLTAINRKKSGALRLVFRSIHFKKRTNCYLSVDFEKFNVYFERYNHRGKHQGEIKWNGTVSGEKDEEGKHDLFMSM